MVRVALQVCKAEIWFVVMVISTMTVVTADKCVGLQSVPWLFEFVAAAKFAFMHYA